MAAAKTFYGTCSSDSKITGSDWVYEDYIDAFEMEIENISDQKRAEEVLKVLDQTKVSQILFLF